MSSVVVKGTYLIRYKENNYRVFVAPCLHFLTTDLHLKQTNIEVSELPAFKVAKNAFVKYFDVIFTQAIELLPLDVQPKHFLSIKI